MKLNNKGSDFTPHPECDEPIKAVIVDITELKQRQTQWGMKDEFRIVYETEMMDEENDRRFCVWSRGYTPFLNDKAAIRKDLKKIMGRDLTKAELEEFDLECLIGHGVKLIIQHEHKDDKTYANITFITNDKDKPLKPSGKYKRTKDRDNEGNSNESTKTADSKPAENEWSDVVVHVGKYKGKKLGEVDENGAKTLIEKWLPNAKAAKNREDAALVAALTELQSVLTGEDY